jgi:hypothetical protein
MPSKNYLKTRVANLYKNRGEISVETADAILSDTNVISMIGRKRGDVSLLENSVNNLKFRR